MIEVIIAIHTSRIAVIVPAGRLGRNPLDWLFRFRTSLVRREKRNAFALDGGSRQQDGPDRLGGDGAPGRLLRKASNRLTSRQTGLGRRERYA